MARDYSYSRLSWADERRLRRKTFLLGGLSILILVVFVFWGLPLIPRVISIVSWGSGGAALQTDKTPPPPPSLFATATATNSAQFILSGMAEPTAQVEIQLNGNRQDPVTVSNDGSFRSGKLQLIQGNNTLLAVAIDAAGNRSQLSNQVTVTFDKTTPGIFVDQPTDGQKFVGSKNQIISVSGNLKKSASLTLNQRYVVVSGDGSFSTSLSLNSGDNPLQLIATDSAGNTASTHLTVSFEP